jgi:probable addiction module antidote protein
MRENTEFLLKDLESVEGLDDLEGIEGIRDFDSAEYLTTKEAIAAYLSFAARSGDVEHLKAAMKTAARAEKMANIAAGAGITREGAYKALKPGSKPQMQTILGLLDALGMAIQIVPKESLADDNSYALAA